jgi:hypothetical protein
MKYVIVLLSGCFLAANAFAAGTEAIIKQRAKELSNQNNVRQGVAPPTQPAQTPGAAASANAAQTQSPALLKLKADLASVTANSQPSAGQKEKIAQDLLAIALGGKPSAATAAKFSEEISAALAEKPLPAASLNRLVQELDAILNPGKYPQAKPDGIFADVQAIFQENGLKRNRAVAISDIVKAAAGEVQRQ